MSGMYKLYYWPVIPGRGEFIRLVLEVAGVPYEDVGRAKDGMSAVIASRGKGLPNAVHYAPPILQLPDGSSLSQTSVITAYLADKFNLVPDGISKFIAMQIDHTVHDVVSECHNTHHPITTTETYEAQKDEAIKASKRFTELRMPAFLSHFEECVKLHSKDEGPFLFGKTMCYVDLSLMYLLRGLEWAFPNHFSSLSKQAPRLIKLSQAVMENERVASYLSSERAIAFSDGIFRKYPELDEI